MTLYALEASFKFHSNESDPSLEDWLDGVSEHLSKLAAKDVSIASSGVDSTFAVSWVVEVADEAAIHDVVKTGMDALRTAFHACEASTADWPTPAAAIHGGINVTLVESSQRVLVSH